MKRLINGKALSIGLPAVFGGVFFAIWYALRFSLELHHYELPTPIEILQAGWKQRVPLARATFTTFIGSASGFILAAIIGFLLSIFLAASSVLRRGLYPYIICMQMIPIIATSAIIVLWLDVGLVSVATIAFFISFFPIVANSLHGLRSVPLEQVELFHIYKASRVQEFLHLRIPFSLPSLFTGLKIHRLRNRRNICGFLGRLRRPRIHDYYLQIKVLDS